MQIAILLFPGAAADDVTGPCVTMGRLSGAQVCFVAERAGMLASDNEAVGLVATKRLSEVMSPDIVVVPGGPGVKDALLQDEVIRWLRAVNNTSRWTMAIRAGSRLLAAAGVLDDDAAFDGDRTEPLMPARPSSLPIVRDGRIATTYGPLPPHDIAVAFAALIIGAEVALLTPPPRQKEEPGPMPFIPDDPTGLSLVPPKWAEQQTTPDR